MKALLYIVFIFIFVSCSSRPVPQRNIALAPTIGSMATCIDAFSMSLKMKANPEDVANTILKEFDDENLPIVLDIGGEGRYVDAININPQPITSTTGESGRIIPNWVPGRGDNIPIPAKTADVLYLENAPMNIATMEEIIRVMRPRGKIHLSHPTDFVETYYDDLINYFGKDNIQRVDNGIITEFDIILP